MIFPIKKSDIIIGYMDTDNSIYVSDRTREHMFFKFGNGFGLSLRVLNLLKEYDIKEVVIRFEKYKELRALVSDFFSYGKRWTDNTRIALSDVKSEQSGRTICPLSPSESYIQNGQLNISEYLEEDKIEELVIEPDEQLILPLEYFNKGMEIRI